MQTWKMSKHEEFRDVEYKSVQDLLQHATSVSEKLKLLQVKPVKKRTDELPAPNTFI